MLTALLSNFFNAILCDNLIFSAMHVFSHLGQHLYQNQFAEQTFQFKLLIYGKYSQKLPNKILNYTIAKFFCNSGENKVGNYSQYKLTV